MPAPPQARGHLTLHGPDGERTVPAAESCVDLVRTAVGEGRLLSAVVVSTRTGWVLAVHPRSTENLKPISEGE